MAELPARIEHLVESTPEGIRYSVKVRSMEALVGAVAFGLITGGLMFVLSIITFFAFPLCVMFLIIGLLVMIVTPLLGYAIHKTAPILITSDGVRQETFGGQTVTWKHVKRLRLTGDAKRRTATLRADAMVLKSWSGVVAHREKGWDAGAVLAFANKVEELSGLVLENDFPGVEGFEEMEAARKKRALELRQNKRAKTEAIAEAQFTELHGIAPAEAVLRDLEESQAYVLDIGERKVPGRETSSTEEMPVTLVDDRLVVGKRSEALASIEAVFVFFQKREGGVDVLLFADLDNGKRWRVARRGSEATAQMKGVMNDLRAKIGHS